VQTLIYKSTSHRERRGGYGHVHPLSTSVPDGTLGSVQLLYISSSTATLDGRTQQQSHFFQHSRSVRLAYTQYVGKARIKSYLDYILSGCTQNSLVFCQKNGKHAATPAPAPSKLDPSVRILPSLRSTLTAGTTFDYTQSRRTRGSLVFLPHARQSRDDARVLS
jgi:hypothetical protein